MDNSWQKNHVPGLCDNSLLNSRYLYDFRHNVDVLNSLDDNLDSSKQRNNIMNLEPEVLLKKINKEIINLDGQLCNKNDLSRGLCAKCFQPVLVNQSRYVNSNGQYCHKICDNLYEYSSNKTNIPKNSPKNGLLNNNIIGYSSYTVLDSTPVEMKSE